MGCAGSKTEEDDVKFIVFCGLDGAGKTTLLRRIRTHIQEIEDQGDPNDDTKDPMQHEVRAAKVEEMDTVPTIGVEAYQLQLRGLPLNILDLSGQEAFRVHWKRYDGQTDLIIFVVDASNRSRLEEARKTLNDFILNNQAICNKPLLIVGNKNDLEGAITVEQLVEGLFGKDAEKQVINRSYHVLSTSALRGDGVRFLMEWFLRK
ncbi:MAG: putative ADP-ribosylation factor [Streblomastix strix]|uniref:Putative ADP-ribosylation factor n=1 Tax=Streblomastix strix TaxID=222440 RepID=A0A5J4XAX4_9EUKA|nr:MAG: putative ADP-ribosylation factor [Streblomastix strix]